MTCDEFSDQMDVLLNSFNIKAGFGEQNNKYGGAVVLDEYEKSVYLTRAQKQLALSLYTGKNSYGDSFESDEEMRRHLSQLVKDSTLKPDTSDNYTGVSSSSTFFILPEDLWFLVYEAVKVSDADCDTLSTLDVFPVTLDDYRRTARNPFRKANSRRVLRLDLSDNTVEIVSTKTVASYYIRYLKRPRPIILRNLSDALYIEGLNVKTECELHEALHQRILEIAVGEAIRDRGVINNKENNK